MSLLDTINAAKKEAEEANSLGSGRSGKDAGAEAKDDDAPERTGFTKKSVTRAKPAREAAAGVRIVSGGGGGGGSSKRKSSSVPERDTSEMTKEEKKQYRRERREEQDRRNSASQVVLRQQPGYKRSQRIWWGLLGAGFLCTIVSWMLPNVFPDQMEGGVTPLSVLVFVLLVAAYVLIIWAFVYDWRVVRPMRKTADAATNGMTSKKVSRILKGEANEIVREQAEKDKAKEARKARRSRRHEQHK